MTAGWDPAPFVLGGAAVAACLFVRGLVRLRRRGRTDCAGAGRALLFAAGLALVVLPLVSPLDGAADHRSLSAHMLQHVLIGDAGPALLLLAVRRPLLAFVLPVAAVRFVARHGRLQGVLGELGRPAVAFGVWALAIAGWHVPAAYDAALSHPLLHDLEHATFVLGGLLVWWQLVDPARRARLSVAGRAALAGLVFLAGQVLCSVLLFARAPFYTAYAHPTLADQQGAGLVMGAEQFLTLGAVVAVLGLSLIRGTSDRPRRAPIGVGHQKSLHRTVIRLVSDTSLGAHANQDGSLGRHPGVRPL
jgi:cytochrome c oxidase assembly factor CtaG